MTEQTKKTETTDNAVLRAFLGGLPMGAFDEAGAGDEILTVMTEAHRYLKQNGGVDYSNREAARAFVTAGELMFVNRKYYEALQAKVEKLEARKPATR
tara:strand:+ start:77 stop:370 length:294 start_codon:yes stop_codon:yes gene_type:complete